MTAYEPYPDQTRRKLSKVGPVQAKLARLRVTSPENLNFEFLEMQFSACLESSLHKLKPTVTVEIYRFKKNYHIFEKGVFCPKFGLANSAPTRPVTIPMLRAESLHFPLHNEWISS